MRSASTSTIGAGVPRGRRRRVDGGAVLEAGADERRLRDHQRHGLPLHVRAHQRAVRVVVLEERDQAVETDTTCAGVDVHELDVLRRRR
jgi:hypothetical protein